MAIYNHKIQYYETDRMGITHHSNYIRIMEEARSDFLEQVGYSYECMEAEGLVSPVLSVVAHFKKSSTYGDTLQVETHMTEMTPIRFTISYVMTSGGSVVCTGESTHCFLDKEGRPVVLKKSCPQIYELFGRLIKEKY